MGTSGVYGITVFSWEPAYTILLIFIILFSIYILLFYSSLHTTRVGCTNAGHERGTKFRWMPEAQGEWRARSSPPWCDVWIKE